MDKKQAQKIASAKWYQKNKEKISASRIGKRTAEHQSYYQRHKEESKLKSREWRKNNPEKIKEILAKSRKSNPARKLFNSAKQRAGKSGVEFTITVKDIHIPEVCPLLGVTISAHNHKDFCPSLDRKDNTKGYTPENIWVISWKANRMKNTASWEELFIFAENLLKYKDIN